MIPCLSVRQPWASLIVHGIKPIENRMWSCVLRKRIAIHASKTWGRDEKDAFDMLLQIAIDHGDTRRQDILYMSRNLLGGFVGSAHLRDCIGEREWYAKGGGKFDGWTSWFVGPIGWYFTGARPFDVFVPYRGQRGLFNIPAADLPEMPVEEARRGCRN